MGKIILALVISLFLSSCASNKKISDTQKIHNQAIVIDEMNVVKKTLLNRSAATAIRGRSGEISMTKQHILSLVLGAVFTDMICSPEIKITGFKIHVPGKSLIKVIGNNLNAEAKKAINDVKKGDEIQILDVDPKVIINDTRWRISKILGMTIKVIE